MRWINHRQHDVDCFHHGFPSLSDFERAANCCNKPENVCGRTNTELVDALLCCREKLRQRFSFSAATGFGENLRRKALVRLGESDVIELNFTEAHPYRFLCNPEIVLPDCVRIWIHPCEPLVIAPRSSIRFP